MSGFFALIAGVAAACALGALFEARRYYRRAAAVHRQTAAASQRVNHLAKTADRARNEAQAAARFVKNERRQIEHLVKSRSYLPPLKGESFQIDLSPAPSPDADALFSELKAAYTDGQLRRGGIVPRPRKVPVDPAEIIPIPLAEIPEEGSPSDDTP